MILGPEVSRPPSPLLSLGGRRTATQITKGYENIVLAFAHDGKNIDITRRELEGALVIHIGASKPDTIVRHIRMMQTLGYIKLAKEGGIAAGARYDLVGKKLREIRIGHGLETDKPAKKGAKKRR